MNTLSKIKYVLLSLLFMLLLIQQIQMQSEIRELRKQQLQFQGEMIKFMESTNSSIEAHNSAIASETKIMRMLAGPRKSWHF